LPTKRAKSQKACVWFKNLIGKGREKLRQEWEEKRYGFLYSRGDKSKEGNLNLKRWKLGKV